MKLDAILWDYDGTLVNSVPKNIDITKDILSLVVPHLTGKNLPKYLHSEELYHQANHGAKNWQELYTDYYGLSHTEMLAAGSLWAEHQQKNMTPVNLFQGIKRVVDSFSTLPHGVCSQNSQANIRRVLNENKIEQPFKAIIGYDDVPSGQQKPHPMAGIKCSEQLFQRTEELLLIYIGDHEADVQFARNIELALGKSSRVISVAAAYSLSQPETWKIQPDHIAHRVEDLISIIGKYVL